VLHRMTLVLLYQTTLWDNFPWGSGPRAQEDS
jgi:hypothetical protein